MNGVEKAVYIEGTVYGNIQLAAKDRNVHATTVRARIQSKEFKWRDWRYSKPTEITDIASTNKRKVVIETTIYDSIYDAARKLQIAVGAVRGRIRSTNELYKNWRFLNPSSIKKRRMGKDVVLMIDKKMYLTQRQAANELKISTGAIIYYLQHPDRYPNCYYWNFKTEEKVPY